jgi:uncharacterized RDD family membrane protein YckC
MNIETNLPEVPQDIFTEQELLNYQDASLGQRFLNYLIDSLVMQYGLGLLTGALVVQLLLAVAPDTAYALFGDENSGSFLISVYLISIVNYLIYYTFCEKVFKGYTLGKLITGTRAIRFDGGELTLKDAFLRTLSRCVPFEPISAFGTAPWHDRWTKTTVVKTR